MCLGKKKGEAAVFSKVKDLEKVVHRDIIPIYTSLVDSRTNQPLQSGDQASDTMSKCQLAYWKVWSASKRRYQGKAMPTPWSEPAWDMFKLFGPHGKKLPEFCPHGLSGPPGTTGASTSRKQAKEREADRKRQKRMEDKEAKDLMAGKENQPPPPAAAKHDTALGEHTDMWAIKLALRHGNSEMQANAQLLLGEKLKKMMTPLVPSSMGAAEPAIEIDVGGHEGSEAPTASHSLEGETDPLDDLEA